jgi:hypothetical protein
MGRDARVPIQGVSVDEGKQGAVSKQEVDTAGVNGPAADASGLGANIDPLGGHQGIQAVKLFKFHVKGPANKAGEHPGGLGVDERIPAQGTSVQQAVGRPVSIAIDIVQPEWVPAA